MRDSVPHASYQMPVNLRKQITFFIQQLIGRLPNYFAASLHGTPSHAAIFKISQRNAVYIG